MRGTVTLSANSEFKSGRLVPHTVASADDHGTGQRRSLKPFLGAPNLSGNASSVASLVSVVIPTLNRHEPLRRAILSILGQRLPAGVSVEVVVVDNSTEANALDVVATLKHEIRPLQRNIEIFYVSEPNPGVSNARNAGVARARGEWVAFLDDDEEALSDWLANHLHTARLSGADAVFGPVLARAEEYDQPVGIFGQLFQRELDLPLGCDITDHSAYLGTNNSMFRRDRCLGDLKPFSVALNGCGGEDSLLLKRLVLSGRRFAWSSSAHVIEWVPPKRLSWAYFYKRKFLSGQIRTFVHTMLDKPQWTNVLRWMAIGAVQVVFWGAGSLLTKSFMPNVSRASWAKALGGLGKILWMSNLRPGLYGKGHVS